MNVLQKEYQSRINRVIDHIEKNIEKDFSLEDLAQIANFSKYHFHRIFFALVGETLFQFIQRLRLEKAANALCCYSNKSITEIAFDCGFSNSASFAKAFRGFYHMSASEWRAKNTTGDSKIGTSDSNSGKTDSNWGKDYFVSSAYITYRNHSQTWRIEMNKKTLTVEVKEIPEMTVAYVRHIGPYAGDSKLFESLYGRLFAWAGPRNLLRFPDTKSIVIYHDNPEITEEDKLRISVCITVPKDTPTDGDIGKLDIPSGKYAFARFELTDKEFGEAWNWVYGEWMPNSGFEPDDRPCFEQYLGDPKEHPEHKFIVDICAPVRPLR